MFKNLFKTIFFLVISTSAFAQTKDETKYKERAAEVQKEIWNAPDKAFEVTTIPEKYKNESAVIIARSYFHTNEQSRGNVFGGKQKLLYYSTFREKIKINDKAALEEFSTLKYKKSLKAVMKLGMLVKLKDSYSAFVSAKVIKPNGEVKITSFEEEVLIKNENNDKEGKLAIADLQVGDMLDYYIRTEEVVETGNHTQGPFMFVFVDDYPILNYNVKYVLDRNCGVDVMNMNGAKPMTESKNEHKNIVLETTEQDLPKAANTLWLSEPRQLPYTVIRYAFGGWGCVANAGDVKRGPFTTWSKNDLKNNFFSFVLTKSSTTDDKKNLKEYFGGKDNLKNVPADSIINYLYNYYRWRNYGGFLNMDVTNKRNSNVISRNFLLSVREVLNDNDIENEYVLVSNRNSKRIDDIFDPSDFDIFIKIKNAGHFAWFCLSDFFLDAGELLPDYQGEKAFMLERKGKGKNAAFTDTEILLALPVSAATQNVSSENIKLNFNKDNLQTVTIQRNCSETGSMKFSDQKKLLLAEDVQAELARLVKMPDKMDAYNEDKKLTDHADEIKAAMKLERSKQKDLFIEDIKDQYDHSPKELISYKITNAGLSSGKPAFEYNEVFTMDDLVKKAGNNFIFEAGKLIGSYKKIEGKERTRSLDVYMPSARTLSYAIDIVLPDGYTAKGVDELNKKVENESASFISSAVLNGNTVHITITRTYNNNFEPAANWPKLLSAMDAAADFTNSKILLEKKK